MTASNGAEALEIIEGTPVHVVISDNKMPGMTGVELIRRIKEVSPDTMRIMLSGQSDMSAVIEAVNEGETFRFLQKPWNDIDLKIAVNLALAHYRLAEENKTLLRLLREQRAGIDDCTTAREQPGDVGEAEPKVNADEAALRPKSAPPASKTGET
jgi:YesN/AraC family two-component response regulator